MGVDAIAELERVSRAPSSLGALNEKLCGSIIRETVREDGSDEVS